MLLKNAKILKDGELVESDILIDGNKISKISKNIDCFDKEIIDLKGKFVTAGFIDVHVHWREPGFSQKETILTASKAAARGGFTTVMTMPNLNPVPDSIEALKKQLNIISSESCIRAIPYGAITREEYGRELSDMDEIAKEIFAFTDDGRGVQSANVMYEAMLKASKLNKAIVAHCEDNSLIRGGAMHEGDKSKELKIAGIPSICESVQVARDILLAEAANCHYHVCHISAKESVRAVREGKKNGIKVSCEVTPHHLLSCDEDIKEDNGMWKMNPPLRAREDKNALIAGILDGTIDIIATDHAPHTQAEKERGIAKSSFGIVGSETAFAQLYTKFVKNDIFSLELLVKLMSENVSKLFNLPYGKFDEGELADIVVIDLEKEITIDSSNFLGKGKNTPYNGEKINGIPVLTLFGGEIVYIDEEEIKL
ncbi:dihydroorotase [Fusobacterium gastrosuis]|uniref:dihydroorotase n=1 Tax=Fusobacterium gastrosuis TaxID=1755100 RepID=UPI002970BA91|nr:dihydroorotase [Fusobacteriaceae bacterium]MDY5712630.1 dihydroorotase [Fusobacterium gastrosuis]